MKTHKTVLVIDGNNLAYKIYASFTEGNRAAGLLTNSVGQPTTLIFGFLRAFTAFTKIASVDSVIVCWDVKGGSQYRKTLYPNYKGNRQYKDMSDYFEELEACRSYFEVLGINQAPIEGIEADDVIGYLSKRLEKKGNKVIIFSDDRDYFQLLSNHIKIFRLCVNEFFTKKDLMEQYASWEGFKPSHLHIIAGIIGQAKDNIPGSMDVDPDTGIPIKFGLGEAKMKALLPLVGWDLKKAKRYLKYDSPLNEKLTGMILKNWKQAKMSIKLMRIRTRDSDYNEADLKTLKRVCKRAQVNQKVSAATAMKLIRDLEITSIGVVPILTSIGINMVGKSGKTYGQGRIKV